MRILAARRQPYASRADGRKPFHQVAGGLRVILIVQDASIRVDFPVAEAQDYGEAIKGSGE